jgi:hypothetical protein
MNASFRAAAVVLAALGCGWVVAAEPAPPPRPAVPEFVSKDWKFAAKFPAEPKAQKQVAAGVAVALFAVESKDGVYGVAVADMPIPDGETAAQTQDRLDGARDGAVGNVGGTLTSSSQITLGKQKYPGREFNATVTQPKAGRLRAQVYLVGKRFYQVIVMGTTEYATAKEATAFLDSFRLTE